MCWRSLEGEEHLDDTDKLKKHKLTKTNSNTANLIYLKKKKPFHVFIVIWFLRFNAKYAKDVWILFKQKIKTETIIISSIF